MARPPKSHKPRRSEDPPGHGDRELVTRIGRSAGGKADYKQLVRELGLGGGRERRLLLDQLTRLVARGELLHTADEMWALPRPDATSSAPAPVSVQGRAGHPNATGSGLGRSETNVRGGGDRVRGDRFVSGRLDLHRDGFGFVRPEPNGTGIGSNRENQDIFIPPHEINGAMQGDLVLVDEAPLGRDGRRSGRIARVLTRRNPTVVGIFHYGRVDGRNQNFYLSNEILKFRDEDDSALGPSIHVDNFVTPLDERIGAAIMIAPGGEGVRGDIGSSNRTLGKEVRNHSIHNNELRQNSRFPLEGLAVDVEITSFPSAGRAARGRVIEVLGPPDAFGVDVEIVIRKHHLPHRFPAAVLAEAGERSLETVSSLPAVDLEAREDFRGLPIVTIDGETARDFDDAVLVRNLSNGNNELQVHIADVSHYVPSGSTIDTEARVRGTSVYFPDRAVPMLPHALSSGMCSLLPNEDRLALSCIMEIDKQGEIIGFRIAEGIIRSVRRMTYTSVQRCINAASFYGANVVPYGEVVVPHCGAEDIAERERVAVEQPELPAAIDRMLELALRLNAKRVRRGSIDFDLPEPVIEFDPDGNMQAIVRSERGWAHRLIEEFMLSANECVATWLEGQGIPSIYRIHEMPNPKRIVEFEETAVGFGHSLGLGNLPVRKFTMKADRRESRQRAGQRSGRGRGRDSRAAQQHEVPESIPVTPQMYQRLVRRISGTPEERILAYLMLRSLKQARYAAQNEGHFALASPHYTHFTSPIRRYPDLIVHRLVRAMLRRGAEPTGGAVLSTDAQPWSEKTGNREQGVGSRRASTEGPIAAEELNDIAVESSQAERRAADAERELIEWKKMKFMAGRVGDDFSAIILSVTKYGFFVELDEMFIEGLVPIGSLAGDHYSFRDTDRTICGARSGHCFAIGQRVQVLLDRIDRQQRRLQFALLPGTEPKANSGAGSLRGGKSEAKKAKAKEVGGKAKQRQRRKAR